MQEPIAIVGSASKGANCLQKVPTDVDFICSAEAFKKFLAEQMETHNLTANWVKKTRAGLACQLSDGTIYEAEFIDRDNPSSVEIYNAIIADPEEVDGRFYHANMDMIYLLKMSHRYLKNSTHFLKTMRDIHTLRKAGAEIRDQDLFKRREAATYGYHLPKLNQTKDEFFSDDGLVYVYDHDSIHESVKHLDRPAYTYYMVDGEEILCSKDKFFNEVSNLVRLYGVLEESYVLALERAVIPHNTDTTLAFEIALQKVCTSITSGWFREFAWENYDRVMEMFKQESPDYVEMFWRGVKNGMVVKL